MMKVPSSGVMASGKIRCKHVAATLELVAGDADVGEQNGESTQHARGLVIANLKQVGQSELSELAGTGSDEVDEQQA